MRMYRVCLLILVFFIALNSTSTENGIMNNSFILKNTYFQSEFDWQTYERNMNVTTFVSPDGSRDELWHFLQSAEQSIYVEIFGVNNPYILDLIHDIKAVKPSLDMKFLLGWNSLGYINENKYVANNLTLLGYEVRWTNDADFIYAHQKFFVIDNETTIIQSGNWAKTSFPEANMKANREWNIAMNDSDIAEHYLSVFDYDWSRGTEYDALTHGTGTPLTYTESSSTYSRPFSEPGHFSEEMNVTPVFSPETSLEAILFCINKSQHTLDIQIPYFTNFGDGGEVDNIVDAIVAAKLRGVTVRVITEEEYDFAEVAAYLGAYDIPVVWQDTRWFTTNHNKAIIVDGIMVMISSINFSDDSIKANREAGVIIENENITQWFLEIYDYDWGLADCDVLDEVNLYWEPNIPTSEDEINVTVYTHMLYPDVDEVILGVKIDEGIWVNYTITENVYNSAESDPENYFYTLAPQSDRSNITAIAYVNASLVWHKSLEMVIHIFNFEEEQGPEIDEPPDVYYYVGETGNNITWHPFADNPHYYEIYNNVSFFKWGWWNSSSEDIFVSVDGLDVGVYNYTIVVCDDEWRNATDTVLVYVLPVEFQTHDPIFIYSDSQFEDIADNENWQGDGSQSNPFRIQNYNITSGSTCISIQQVSYYFVIYNCSLLGEGGFGIILYSCDNAKVEKCEIYMKELGIGVYSSSGTKLINNTIYDLVGLNGIYVESSPDCYMINNSLNGCGFWFWASTHEGVRHEVSDNIVNGKPFGYFWQEEGTIFDGNLFGQIILANCTDVVVEGGEFQEIGVGVEFLFCDECSLIYSEIHDTYSGFIAYSSNYTYLDYNNVTENFGYGIFLNVSSHCCVCNNTVDSSGEIGIGLQESHYSTIWNNTAANNDYGIDVGVSTNVKIFHNKVFYNVYNGINLWWGATNCYVWGNTLAWNGENNAYDDGSENYWDNSISVGNSWSDYVGPGFYTIPGEAGSIDHYPSFYGDFTPPVIDQPEDMTIYEWSEDNIINWTAYDDHPDYYEVLKNGSHYTWGFWKNAEKIIIEIEPLEAGFYNFTIIFADFSMNNSTDYVFVTVIPDTEYAVIVEPEDLDYVVGETGNTIIWIAYDINPTWYEVLKNGSFYTWGFWENDTPIVVEIDGLNPGVYNFTITVCDIGNNNITDSVFVRVFEQTGPMIVFDYSHGQYAEITAPIDEALRNNLTALGYAVICAFGGINSSILENADALIIGSIMSINNEFTEDEIVAIAEWFSLGNKFLWVSCDSDYNSTTSGQFINDNMTAILEAVGSHVYPEPTSVVDGFSNCGENFRVVANGTTNDPRFSSIVEGVTAVLMHGPTLLYGSSSAQYGVDMIALEDSYLENVYPLLYYAASGTILDDASPLPLAHFDGQVGGFVAVTLEMNAGPSGSGIIMVSGASAYADYRPMCTDSYYGFGLNGARFVKQAIHFALSGALANLTVDHPQDIEMEEDDTGISIEWKPNATSPDAYSIYLNGTLVSSGKWNSSNEIIFFNITGLQAGTYVIEILLNDTYGNSITDEVILAILDTTPPEIEDLEDFTNELSNYLVLLSWTAYDLNPHYYVILLNGTKIKEGAWNSTTETISLLVMILEKGVYNYTAIVSDIGLNNASDSVLITVIDTEAPNINHPPDVHYFEGYTGHIIKWNPFDEDPFWYEILLNDTTIREGLWNSSSEAIEINVDELELGMFNYTLVVLDLSENEASDSVLVFVTDGTIPTINRPNDIVYTEGETGNAIGWIPMDAHPGSYIVYQNGTGIRWVNRWESGVLINVSVDHLQPGRYNYTIKVMDVGENSVVDTVYVTVLSTTGQTDTTTTTSILTTTPFEFIQILSIAITIGSGIVIVVFVVLIIRARRMAKWEKQIGM